MLLKDAIKTNKGLNLIYSSIDIRSDIGRKLLLNTPFSCDETLLIESYKLIEKCQNYIQKTQKENKYKSISNLLSQLKDVSGTIREIENKNTLDDVSLFLIKEFCLCASKIKALLFDNSSQSNILEDVNFNIPSLDSIIDILDPEHLRLNQFYIYDAYSKELEEKRKILQTLNKDDEKDEASKVYSACLLIEDKVREKLSKELYENIGYLNSTLNALARIDKFFALAVFSLEKEFNLPQINKENKIEYSSLFYYPLEERLKEKGESSQRIDIELSFMPSLIRGANMAGKTIVLKSLFLAQLCAQFGFFVSAKTSSITLVEQVLYSIGDNQNEDKGLSSFASEIIILNDIIKKTNTDKKYLILVDELARTTNPKEGVAMVNGFLSTMKNRKSFSVITTHYNQIEVLCHRLRVKGFVYKQIEEEKLNLEEIQKRIDYSLIEDIEDNAPNEAINIAKLLDVDKDFIKESLKYLK
ncbi:MAG: hypothetical protein LBM25_06670 [Bacteroidales bacterium]|jgi:dsDNA-specific endonuclease/ATPase MutS2|nr:hypothetical protein [Bacteroidales bacterium]